MDRETRAFAESHFQRLRGRPAGAVGATPGRVDFIESPDSFSYADFFKGYLLPNVPCVFSSAFTEGWGSRRRWVTPGGKPDFEHLLRNYGTCGARELPRPGGPPPPAEGAQCQTASCFRRRGRPRGQLWGPGVQLQP